MPTHFRVREVAEAQRVGQRELARQSGVSYPTVNKLFAPPERQTRRVDLDTLDAVAGTLGVHPGELLDYTPPL